MITKEIVKGEEVFAIEHPEKTFACGTCMFDARNGGGGDCMDIRCMTSERGDKVGVYFRPTHDLKTLAAYHAQEKGNEKTTQ